MKNFRSSFFISEIFRIREYGMVSLPNSVIVIGGDIGSSKATKTIAQYDGGKL